MVKSWMKRVGRRLSDKRRRKKMVTGRDAARYLISLDSEKCYFNKKVIEASERTFYEGSARLNKILHLANNMYIAKTGSRCIRDDFYAYDNGAIIPDIQENYATILASQEVESFQVDEPYRTHLHKTFLMLKDAPIEELIRIDHEDPAWKEKHMYYQKENQKMDPMKYAEDYKDRYEAANFYLDHMEIA